VADAEVAAVGFLADGVLQPRTAGADGFMRRRNGRTLAVEPPHSGPSAAEHLSGRCHSSSVSRVQACACPRACP